MTSPSTQEYAEVFKKFCREGFESLSLEEQTTLSQGRGSTFLDNGFKFPGDWAGEIFKNISSQTVMFPDADHRQPGREIDYDVFPASLFVTQTATDDRTFDLWDEMTESISELVAVIFDQNITSNGRKHGITGLLTNAENSRHESQHGEHVTLADLQAMLDRVRLHTDDVKWYMNSDTGQQLANVPEGDELIIAADEVGVRTAGVPYRLLDLPVVYNEYMDEVSSGKYPIILANLKEAYIADIRDDIVVYRKVESLKNKADNTELPAIHFTFHLQLGGRPVVADAYRVLQMKE